MLKPILFNTDMVRAILAGKKTVTRRVVKPQPTWSGLNMRWDWGKIAWWRDNWNAIDSIPDKNKPCKIGDILYVRETWCDPSGTGWPIYYKADLPMHWDADETEHGEAVDLRVEDFTWRPSIHMPKEEARIFLRVTDVRVERLQEIDEVQAQREGCYAGPIITGSALWADARTYFPAVWDRTLKSNVDRETYGWEANPWVWVIEFERCEKPEA